MSQASMPGRPSEADLHAMLAELREAPVEEVIAQAANLLLQAAQVKLGRPDARVLIDAVAAVAGTVADRTRGGLAAQIGEAVAQLRLAQVEAERELGTGPVEGEPGAPTGGVDRDRPGPGAGRPTAPGGSAPGAPGASRLWVPGR